MPERRPPGPASKDPARPEPRFALGQTVATPAALEALARAGQEAGEFLFRHQYGDWGDLSPEDVAANEAGVEQGARILSAYTLNTGVTVWVITEHDRSATTILLPQDY
jgi:hypothetical protein